MLHPDIVMKRSSIEGTGLFAKKKIPKGTIIYREKNDVRIYNPSQIRKFSKRYQDILTKFANEENGKIIHHKDKAKYGNHSCGPNAHAIISGYLYSDIAITDIQCNEEVTWDYGVLFPSWKKPIHCECGSKTCRKIICRLHYNSKAAHKLKTLTKKAEKEIFKVKQPLLNQKELYKCIEMISKKKLLLYLENRYSDYQNQIIS